MHYPRKTPSRREKAFDMYRAGATAKQVVDNLGLAPRTAIYYRGLFNRKQEATQGIRLISLHINVPSCHYMRCKAFEQWVQESCVPVFFAAPVKSDP